MKIYVRAKVNSDKKLKWSADHYISKYKKYNLECKIIDDDIGLIYDKYKLKLKGNKDNLERYLGYLQRKGFIIETTPSKFNLL